MMSCFFSLVSMTDNNALTSLSKVNDPLCKPSTIGSYQPSYAIHKLFHSLYASLNLLKRLTVEHCLQATCERQR